MTTLRFLIILFVVLNALAFAAIQGWLGGGAQTGEPERIANQLNPEHIRLTHEAQRAADNAGAAAASDTPAAPATAPATAAVLEPQPAPAQPAEDEAGAGVVDAEDEINRDSAVADPAPVAEGSMPPAPVAPVPPASVAPAQRAVAPAAICQTWVNLTTAEADRLGQRLRGIGVTPARSRSDTPDSWWVRIPPQASRAEAETRVAELRLLGISDTFIVQEPGPTQYAVSLGVFKTENRARVLLGQLRTRGVSNAGIEPRMTTSYRVQATLPAAELRRIEQGIARLAARRQSCAAR